MPIRSLLALAAAVALTPVAASAAAQPSQLVVFGDSLVDAGNIFLLTGGFAPTNVYNNPSRGYFPGRFTNGPDYTDLLSQRLYGSYASPSIAGGSNYAFGGAKVVTDGDVVPDLSAQLGLYSAAHPLADPNALYIINAGGNDDFAVEGADPATVAAAATNIADTMAGAVQFLSASGATRILVTGIPNATATGFALDAALQAKLDTIEPTLTADLMRFSYLDFFTRLAADPLKFGVPPVTEAGACFDHRTPIAGSIDCSGFSTVDGIHPIAPIQAAIFREVAHLTGIGSVPEPGTWALMITGFGLVGTALRRRKPGAVARPQAGVVAPPQAGVVARPQDRLAA